MLNKRPIFIVAFTHGGSTILLNLLRSHPDVCSPRGETSELFFGKGNDPIILRLRKFFRYLPIIFWENSNIFSARAWREPEKISERTWAKFDTIVYFDKLLARGPTQNLQKTPEAFYTDDEILCSRSLLKNMNGLIMLSRRIYEAYPDATFFAVVRNGLAVCEGNMRRGTPLEVAAKRYAMGCARIFEDQFLLPRFRVVRYEDLVGRPYETFNEILSFADLDSELVEYVRLETTQKLKDNRSVVSMGSRPNKALVWYPRNEFGEYLVNMNEKQISRLSGDQKKVIMDHCEDVMAKFGYV